MQEEKQKSAIREWENPPRGEEWLLEHSHTICCGRNFTYVRNVNVRILQLRVKCIWAFCSNRVNKDRHYPNVGSASLETEEH